MQRPIGIDTANGPPESLIVRSGWVTSIAMTFATSSRRSSRPFTTSTASLAAAPKTLTTVERRSKG